MPALDAGEARRRFAGARVAYLATVRADGRPHVVPIVFALQGDHVYSVADPKPKRGSDLLRHRNIEANPSVSLLADAYDEEWERLWWARADGTAQVIEEGPERDIGIRLLRDRYPQYSTWTTPFGAATVVRVKRWSGWALAEG